MASRRIVAIWYRVLQPGEFFNIERHPDLVVGGGGSRYIEIPKSITTDTLRFFDYNAPALAGGGFTVAAAPIGNMNLQPAPINIQIKAGGRLRIANQNRQASPNRRHPAWSGAAGFPVAPNGVRNRAEARPYLPQGGIRIFIAKLSDATFLAGFAEGPRPADIPPSSPLQRLYVNSGVGGVLLGLDLPITGGSSPS